VGGAGGGGPYEPHPLFEEDGEATRKAERMVSAPSPENSVTFFIFKFCIKCM
jgi:hypothetical protein